jgi:DNA invertase Pin-like site-specific DNA recombinase
METRLIGYARVSTEEQNLDLQIDALTAAGCKKIFVEKASGGKKNRPELTKALAFIRQGETFCVYKLDRAGRSLMHLLQMVENLRSRSIGFKSLNESIDTTTAAGNMLFQIMGAFAEFEKSVIRERTLAGLAAARARGRIGGRPKKRKLVPPTPEEIAAGA